MTTTIRTFVIGDIHGAYRALIQCLTACNFDCNNDTLILLGDVVDGWPDTVLCIEELLKIKNLIKIMGNHDYWHQDWLNNNIMPIIWYNSGGKYTMRDYDNNPEYKQKHKDFFNDALPYYIDEDNRIFCHGSFNIDKPINKQYNYDLYWDRHLAYQAFATPNLLIDNYKEVFLGHTTTTKYSTIPFNSGNVWLLDTGAGWDGRLSIMDVNTHQYWQSDIVRILYPEREFLSV